MLAPESSSTTARSPHRARVASTDARTDDVAIVEGPAGSVDVLHERLAPDLAHRRVLDRKVLLNAGSILLDLEQVGQGHALPFVKEATVTRCDQGETPPFGLQPAVGAAASLAGAGAAGPASTDSTVQPAPTAMPTSTVPR